MPQFQPPFQPPGQYQPQPPMPPAPQPPKKRRRWLWLVALAVGLLLFFGILGATQSQTPIVTGSTPTAIVTQQSSIPTAQPPATPTAKPAATPTAIPTPKPTAKPTAVAILHPTPTPKPAPPPPTPTPCPDPCNPFGYNFSPGNLIYSPPSNFCDYFNCIASFWDGSGYVNECQDSTYSKSGGISGDCSHHGGYYRTLYSH